MQTPVSTPGPLASVAEVERSAVGTEAHTTTTLEDLYSTLKKLEEEENFLTARSEKKQSWCKCLTILIHEARNEGTICFFSPSVITSGFADLFYIYLFLKLISSSSSSICQKTQ